ncbi:DeoR/GlpR transcriptional regulator [Lachnospiraceae bacterium]|jgi:DeoR family deoxyribose operon repressor|nr:DeoR/GlpR family DNA-binding transcription regulator [uncultured Schaedlerella sp.]EOS37671.1 hypothetical protein C808_03651 [Lachnospiraceae bacterium M18-1]NBI59368.1 DeoR/GlpR transcriptional regulator [Lachnospiraceae bacterium]
MNKKERRQAELVKIIETHGMLSMKDMASLLQVSPMTVYRDLNELKYKPDMTASPDSPGEDDETNSSYNLIQAIQESNEQKERIGKFAASLIHENDIIILDTGSTVDRMLPYIPENKNISIVCFNANVLAELRHKQGIHIFFAGGIYHPETELCESPEGIMFLKRLRANKLFLSAAGVHEQLGITCAKEYETATKKAIIESASTRILLADSGKFGRVCSSYFCDLDIVHRVVTDNKISDPWKQLLEEDGIQLDIV